MTSTNNQQEPNFFFFRPYCKIMALEGAALLLYRCAWQTHIQIATLPHYVLQWADPGFTPRAPDPQGQVAGAKSRLTLTMDTSDCVNNTDCVWTVFPIHHGDYARVWRIKI